MRGDQTSVGDVREWCRSGRGGQLLFWGMKGGMERVDKPGYA